MVAVGRAREQVGTANGHGIGWGRCPPQRGRSGPRRAAPAAEVARQVDAIANDAGLVAIWGRTHPRQWEGWARVAGNQRRARVASPTPL